MLKQIKGLHHVTSLARDALANNAFFTKTLGLRRVKKTVNFDAPYVYHLYYGDEFGSPGSIITYFPFPRIAAGHAGTGEAGTTAFAVPPGSLDFWSARLTVMAVEGLKQDVAFDQRRLRFAGPDGEGLALVEVDGDPRTPWLHGGIAADHAIRGFHSVSLRLRDGSSTVELLKLLGYAETANAGATQRLAISNGGGNGSGNGAELIDIETIPSGAPSREGAGSVHHIAFSVDDQTAQKSVRQALLEAGQRITPVVDRDYFWSIYFRTEGGVLFEIATNEPGFARDEDQAHLGESLKLPSQHEHLREKLERTLVPITD
jgi:glyoxalase family protein